MAGVTQSEKLAVLTQRMDDHERGCLARMEEIKATFVDVKSDTKKIHDLIIGLLVTISCGSVALIVAIMLKAVELQ